MIIPISIESNKRQSLTRLFLMPAGFGILLYLFRTLYSGSNYYGFLVWNLFLAFIPLCLSYLMTKNRGRRILMAVMGPLWILFLPNAPYIITDFIHLAKDPPVPMWFDIILIMVFAWNGLVIWVVSVLQVTAIIRSQIKNKYHKISVHLIILLSSIGVYLGRYGRWNSWDVFTDPLAIIDRVFQMVLHPLNNPGFYGMTIILYAFLAFLFSFFTQFADPIYPSFKSSPKADSLGR